MENRHGQPATYFSLSLRKRRTDEFARGDTYHDLETAKEFAHELVRRYRYYQVVILDSHGIQVYDNRKP